MTVRILTEHTKFDDGSCETGTTFTLVEHTDKLTNKHFPAIQDPTNEHVGEWISITPARYIKVSTNITLVVQDGGFYYG